MIRPAENLIIYCT